MVNGSSPASRVRTGGTGTPAPATQTTQTPATQNEAWGFWGTMEEHAPAAWPLALQAICAATHNAAASIDLQDEVGRLVPGLSADVIVLDTPDYRDLVYHAGSSLIAAVYHRGDAVGESESS